MEESFFREDVGITLPTACSASAEAGAALETAIVRDARVDSLDVAIDSLNPVTTISMNHGWRPMIPSRRDLVVVSNNNGTRDDAAHLP